jgi:LPS-assembly protein
LNYETFAPKDKAVLDFSASVIASRQVIFRQIAFTFMRLRYYFFLLILIICSNTAFAQQTNPVEREVTNPLRDQPSVNPLNQELTPTPTPTPPKTSKVESEGDFEDVQVDANKQSVSGPENARVFVYEGNVDVHYGIYRLQADKITIIEAKNLAIAEGSVVFDQGNDQRITGTKAEWNYKTKLGYFLNSTGFTNQTIDRTILYFTADRVERVAMDEILIINAKVTACERDNIPKWSFTSKKVRIKTNDRVKLKRPTFRVKDIPVVPLPYASISIKKRDRASGFLTPTVGFSADKGARISNAYYLTLGNSADITIRNDIYTSRGLGFGFDLRTRANSRSFFNLGFYTVRDRLWGKTGRDKPNQGGSSFYADGVHYFPNGFTASADVKITSNLAFRQVFGEGVQQIISPIEVSQVFINKSWNSYSLNFLARSQVISIPNVRISTRNLPSVTFEKRPTTLSFFKNAPIYFSWKGSLEGVSRREAVEDVNAYRQVTGSDPIVSPALGQRLDLFPQLIVPLNFNGWTLTATGGYRMTYYSNSMDERTRRVIGRDLLRGYAELELDLRPPALAKNFYRKDNSFRFRHVIEPFLAYRRISGVNDFRKTLLFDYTDAIADTNEFEYGVTNRFYTRRYTDRPASEIKKTETIQTSSQTVFQNSDAQKNDSLSIQPYEIFTLTVRGKYFVDPYFGGALIPGRRNQFFPLTTLSAFTYGGVPRRWSPLNVDLTYRPRKTVFANTRFDYGLQGGQLRNVSATIGYDTPLLKIFQTFYYTRAINLVPSLSQFANAAGKEPGTQRGSQWSPTIFVGNRERGWFGGTAMFFDFQNPREFRGSPLVSSTTTLGYAYDCCSLVLQYSNFNVGLRSENRVLFSFRLNGIGTFGTEQFGQPFR